MKDREVNIEISIWITNILRFDEIVYTSCHKLCEKVINSQTWPTLINQQY